MLQLLSTSALSTATIATCSLAENVLLNPITVSATGIKTAFNKPDTNAVIASEGDFAMNHGFDGFGHGTINLAQDIGVIKSGDFLTFNYRTGWELQTYTT